MDGALCILCKCRCSQFYSSDNCVTGNINSNKCGQTCGLATLNLHNGGQAVSAAPGYL